VRNWRYALYEALVEYAGKAFAPLLAESWRCAEDARTWIFNLREGVYFHDGKTLTARDVVYSLKRAAGPLAVPLIAGPSTLATVILLATRHPDMILRWVFALLIAWSAALLILLFADLLRRLLGNRVIQAIERLMGMILTTMAVQMLLSGVRVFMLSI
jgi:small neutral amino acid transporter SnatA (MarC family)